MLCDAVREIRIAERRARAADERRVAEREALTLAETYAVTLEDMLEDGASVVPDPLFVEIRRFVRRHSRRMGRRLRDEHGAHPALALDVLFDVQELLQDRGPALALAD